ncbi:MAG: flippase activity-associated protein Agl23, partial [Chloroflexota bacterium]
DLVIVLAIVTSFVMLYVRVMSHDESLHTFYSWELYQGKGFVHTPLMHGTFQFHALALTYALFGASDFTARIPVALFGVAAVALIWGFRKWLGKTGALLGALFMLISPYMLFYSRYVRNESYVVVWGLLMALALFNYMERREAKWLYTMVAATSLMYTTKEVSYIYVAIWMLFLGFIFLYEMFKANWDNSQYRQIFIASIGLAVVAGAAAGVLFAVSQGAGDLLSTTATAVPSDPNAPITAASEPVNPIKQGAAIAFVSMLGLFLLGGLMCLLQFRERLRDYAVDDLLIVLGTFVLPQLAAFPVRFLLKADPLDYSQAGILKTATVFVPLFLLSVGAGVLWDWKKWLICAGIFYGIFVPLFTTMFTNGNGFWSGIVGSLGYWLDQQPVQRGSQPWYFYLLVQTPIYEFLPAIGALIAAGLGLARLSRTKDVGETLNVDSPTGGHKFPALLFTGFWAVMAMIGYSAAGEKMPWLEVHVTFPMILLAGWAFGQILDAVDWAAFREQLGWVAALVVPLGGLGTYPTMIY